MWWGGWDGSAGTAAAWTVPQPRQGPERSDCDVSMLPVEDWGAQVPSARCPGAQRAARGCGWSHTVQAAAGMLA